MQLSAVMDCNGRSNNIERDSDLGDDMSHGDRTDEDDMRDCDSLDGDNNNRQQQQQQQQTAAARRTPTTANGSKVKRLNHHSISTNGAAGGVVGVGSVGSGVSAVSGGMYFNDNGSNGELSPRQHAELELRHHQLPPNHPLNTLGSFMGIGGLHGIPNLQTHSDVLEKLKMQVRDMKVGLDPDYAAHGLALAGGMLPTTHNSSFTLPPPAIATFGAAAQQQQQQQQQAANGSSAAHQAAFAANNGTLGGVAAAAAAAAAAAVGNGGAFAFTSPTAPNAKEVNSASNSSTSSEASNSSQQNNGWSFEEQYKQVRQLYEINDDPKRKEFLDDLFSFMQKRGTPINRLPIMAKSVLDLYELYNLVIARGGLVDVINKKLWQEIIKGLHLPSSITSAAFTLRTQYMKYLYPYECEKKNLSTPAELQAAIDGNRREGRRSSYGQYEAMHSQIPMSQMSRPTLPGGLQQMSPLELVTHAAVANNQAQAAAAAAAAAHRRLMASGAAGAAAGAGGGPRSGFGQMPNLMTQQIESRMMEYLQLIQGKKDPNLLGLGAVNGVGVGGVGSAANNLLDSPHHHQQQQQQQQQHQQQHQQRQRSPSPDMSTHDALSALKMSHVALWQMYHNHNNNTSPPAGGGGGILNNSIEQQREALNLSDSLPSYNIKREREREQTPESNIGAGGAGSTIDEDDSDPPPSKRLGASFLPAAAFPANFYLNQQQQQQQQQQQEQQHRQQQHNIAHMDHHSDGEPDDEIDDDDNHFNGAADIADDYEHGHGNVQSLHETNERLREHLNGNIGRNGSDGNNSGGGGNHLLDKSDDSAIENSPSTSTGNRHSSPISTKMKSCVKDSNKLDVSDCSNNSGSNNNKNSNSNNNNCAATAIGSNLSTSLEALSLLSGLQFQVTRNGYSANGEQQLVVNLQLNGVKFSGVLVANTNYTNNKKLNSSNSSIRKCNNDIEQATEALEADDEQDQDDEHVVANNSSMSEQHSSPCRNRSSNSSKSNNNNKSNKHLENAAGDDDEMLGDEVVAAENLAHDNDDDVDDIDNAVMCGRTKSTTCNIVLKKDMSESVSNSNNNNSNNNSKSIEKVANKLALTPLNEAVLSSI